MASVLRILSYLMITPVSMNLILTFVELKVYPKIDPVVEDVFLVELKYMKNAFQKKTLLFVTGNCNLLTNPVTENV